MAWTTQQRGRTKDKSVGLRHGYGRRDSYGYISGVFFLVIQFPAEKNIALVMSCRSTAQAQIVASVGGGSHGLVTCP